MSNYRKRRGGQGATRGSQSTGEAGSRPVHDVRHRTIAWYDSPDALRHVELDLERHGVDSVYISTPHVDSESRGNQVDDETAKWAFSRTAIGLMAGAVIGALVAAAVSVAFIGTLKGALMFGVAGAAFGLFAGFFYGVFVNLPADPEVFDTFGMYDDEPASNWISVEGSPEDRETASQVMAGHQPRKLVES